jgi:predicted nucleic acid-binding protein
MTLLLDTTVLVDVLRGRTHALTMLSEAARSGHTFATSVMNVAEVYAGIKPNEGSMAREFLDQLTKHDITPSIAEHGGRLVNMWARQGRTLTVVDTIVAATALEHNLALVTANRKDFPMPELKFYPAA